MDYFVRRILYLTLFVMLMAIPLPPGAIAEEESLSENTTSEGLYAYQDEPMPEFPSIRQATIKMVVSLLVVLAAMIGLLYLIKRFLPGGIPLRDQKFKMVKVVERVPLAPKQNIYLLWVVDRMLVVAANQDQLTMLTEIKDKNVLQQSVPPEFTDVLNREDLELAEAYQNA